MKTSRFIAAGAGIAAATSFYYTMAYVSRWEWNRAQMAGTFTVLAALIAAVVMVDAHLREVRRGLDRLAELTERAGRTEHADRRGESVLSFGEPSPVGSSTVTDDRDFAWLTVKPERYGVFIPLLVGAGMLASGLAWVMEHIFARAAGGFGRRGRSAGSGASGRPGRSETAVRRAAGPKLPESLLLPADAGFEAYELAPPGPDTADASPTTTADQAELWLRGKTLGAVGPSSQEGTRP